MNKKKERNDFRKFNAYLQKLIRRRLPGRLAGSFCRCNKAVNRKNSDQKREREGKGEIIAGCRVVGG